MPHLPRLPPLTPTNVTHVHGAPAVSDGQASYHTPDTVCDGQADAYLTPRGRHLMLRRKHIGGRRYEYHAVAYTGHANTTIASMALSQKHP